MTRTSVLVFRWWSLTIPFCHVLNRKLTDIYTTFTLRKAKKVFPLPPLIAFRFPKNLRDIVVRTALEPPPRTLPCNYQCGIAECKTCPVLVATDEVSSHSTGEMFEVRVRASCKSSNIISLNICRRCGKQYLGETGQELHCRINNHHHDITYWRTEDSPVTEHFNSLAHLEADIAVMVID